MSNITQSQSNYPTPASPYIPNFPDQDNSHSQHSRNQHHDEINPYIKYDYFSISEYKWVLLILIICFIYSTYYFYSIVKKYNQKIGNSEEDAKAKQSKYEILKNISIYSLIRTVSLSIIFIFGDPFFNDLTSFFIYSIRVFPVLILLSILLNHVSFLIEKYYQLKFKKNDIFFNASLEVLNIIIYIIFFIFTFTCAIKSQYKLYQILSEGIVAFVTSFISVLYLYYGLNLSSFYSPKNAPHEFKEKKFLYYKLLYMSLIIGIILSTKSLISYMVLLGIIHRHPQRINQSIWEFLIIFFSEYIILYVIGITKSGKEEKADSALSQVGLNYMNINEREGKNRERERENENEREGKDSKRGSLKMNYLGNNYFYNDDLKEPLI